MSTYDDDNQITFDLAELDGPGGTDADAEQIENPFEHRFMTEQPASLDERIRTTYSMWAKFRNCRKAFELRYMCGLVPKTEKTRALSFGSVIHDCLEKWYLHGTIMDIETIIDDAYPDRHHDPDQRSAHHYAIALMRAYVRHYGHETDIKTLAVEEEFTHPITNPVTGCESKTFIMAGKIDWVIGLTVTDEIYITDHKTAGTLSGDAIERLWCDLQLLLYARYYSLITGIPIAGGAHNILVKPRLKQREGETEEEYQIRYAELCERDRQRKLENPPKQREGETEKEYQIRHAELCAKSKSGKSSAQRKMPETDEEYQVRLDEWRKGVVGRSSAERQMPETDEKFQERLADWFDNAEPDSPRFHREFIPFDAARIAAVETEIWQLTKQLLHARRTNQFYQNTDYCFRYSRACEYWPICRSGMNEIVASTQYRVEAPHGELTGEGGENGENGDNSTDEPTGRQGTLAF